MLSTGFINVRVNIILRICQTENGEFGLEKRFNSAIIYS